MKKMKSPEVTVVITNYNYANYLEQAIESVLHQTYRKIQLLIIDDASTDNSGAILDKYNQKAKIIKHKKNKGIVYARNEALNSVQTQYILFLDADDWLEDDYVQKLVEAAELDGLDVAYCGMQYYIDGGKDMNWIPPIFNVERLKNENYIHMSSLIRVKSIDETRFDKGMEKLTHEDWDFFLNLALKGLNFKRVDGVSLNYRFKPTGRNIKAGADEKFAYLYKYLYEKYSNEKPDEVGYLAYYKFAQSFLDVSGKLNESERQSRQMAEEISCLKTELDNTNRKLSDIHRSKSYRIGKAIVFPAKIIKRFINKLSTISYGSLTRRMIYNSKLVNFLKNISYRMFNNRAKGERYFVRREGSFRAISKNAIVLHLYHTDNWEKIFARKLIRLSEKMRFDLYVTMPESNIYFKQQILNVFPQANFLITPNKGRDVLPFIKTALLLSDMGYENVLKIHSKKSTHRDHTGNTAEGGEQWLLKTLDALIPEDEHTMNLVIKKLQDHDTGMIGPLEYYYPIKMYLKSNLKMIVRFMKYVDPTIFSGIIAHKLDNLGFFGGTMFWARLGVIEEALLVSKNNFQSERGQTDGTFAHALERIFSILAHAKKKKVYGTAPNQLVRLGERTIIHYPSWYADDILSGSPHISIVVPVYSDWSSLSKNIKSLKKIIANDNRVSVYYVNDCGPEADILEKKILKQIKNLTNFYYYRNENNLGFVKTCNRATFELVNNSDDVLLLNSDTKVTKNFVFEMRDVLYSENNIGAVTSRSNNATIWSIPMNSKFANHRMLSYVLYRIIKRSLPQKYLTPTIHGFCVLIRREVIQKYGLFDEIYGKGYAEENDFAMRIRGNGWFCAVANYSFVFHYESRSFGTSLRSKQIENNEKILLERYPDYRELVQRYWDSIQEPLK